MDAISTAGDALANLWDAFGDWLTTNELMADLVTVWAIVLCLAIVAVSELIVWGVIARQHDQTPVGKALRRQNPALAIMHGSFVVLYGASLVLYYFGPTYAVTLWQRMALRLLIVVGGLVAAYACLRLIRALRNENWGQPDREPRDVTGLP